MSKKAYFLTTLLLISVLSAAYFSKRLLVNNKVLNSSDIAPATEVKSETQIEVVEVPSNDENEVLSEKVEAIAQTKKNRVNFGVVVNNYSNSTGELSAIENQTGVTISTVGIYKQFGHPTNKNLVQSDLAYIKITGKKLMITFEPWNPNEGMAQSTDYLKEINEGKHDAYITSFAQSVKEFGNTTYLRFAHEMNGNWYPWSQKPTLYVGAYRRVVELFRSAGASNVKFVWSINAENVPAEPIGNISKYYPGDAFIDVIGIDGYNFGSSNPNTSWRSFSSIFASPYNHLSKTYSKPIYITEVASAEAGGDKSLWVNDMFASIDSMPNIREIIWFNLLKETDWRIDSSPSSLKSFDTNL